MVDRRSLYCWKWWLTVLNVSKFVHFSNADPLDILSILRFYICVNKTLAQVNERTQCEYVKYQSKKRIWEENK